MDFPISDLMSESASTDWIMAHFHPNGVVCVHCGAPWSRAFAFRRTRKSELIVYRCRDCGGIYNLYSGTIFAARQLRPSQVVLLMRGVLKGESARTLARELGMSRTTVTALRFLIQHTAFHNTPQHAISDQAVEADELFQNAGEKKRCPSALVRSAAPAGQQAAGTGHVCQ